MTLRAAVAALVAMLLLGATPTQLDSEYVLQRYALALDTAVVPKTVVFTYAVSQAGAGNIEQRHVVYRSGDEVRDETIAVDGVTLHHKIVRISHRADRYAVTALAPRSDAYQMLFLRTARDGRHVDYVYEATPLVRQPGASIDRITIDGQRYLPRSLHFLTDGETARGSGTVEYAAAGRYWVPVAATADAIVNGKPARERITWSDYRFPESLPDSTFQAARPLPHPSMPLL